MWAAVLVCRVLKSLLLVWADSSSKRESVCAAACASRFCTGCDAVAVTSCFFGGSLAGIGPLRSATFLVQWAGGLLEEATLVAF